MEIDDFAKSCAERSLFGGEQLLEGSLFTLILAFRFGGVAATEVAAESWSPGQCQDQRSDQRSSQSNGKCPEKCSRDSRDRNQRQEHNYRCDRGTDQGDCDLAQRTANRFQPALACIAMENDVLDHNDC